MPPGVMIVAGMSVQIPPGGLVLKEGEDGEPDLDVQEYLLRLDLWPNWLDIGCAHAARAAEATAELRPEALDDTTKASLLTQELHDAMVAVTAFAFAMDGFYDVVQHELGKHPDVAIWREKGKTARHTQVAETFRYHLKPDPNFTANMTTVIEELFKFRGRAVHPSSEFKKPNYRPEIDSAVHPHFITFSGPHAAQCRGVVLTIVDRLLIRARELAKPGADTGWLDRGRKVMDRLLAAYPVSPDEPVAFAEYMAAPPP